MLRVGLHLHITEIVDVIMLISHSQSVHKPIGMGHTGGKALANYKVNNSDNITFSHNWMGMDLKWSLWAVISITLAVLKGFMKLCPKKKLIIDDKLVVIVTLPPHFWSPQHQHTDGWELLRI